MTATKTAVSGQQFGHPDLHRREFGVRRRHPRHRPIRGFRRSARRRRVGRRPEFIRLGQLARLQVHAQQAIVAGTITGGLIVKDKLEIGYTAVIRGKVSARTVAIAKGAIVDGEIEVTSDAPVLQFEEKRDNKAERRLIARCSRMATVIQSWCVRVYSRILAPSFASAYGK